MKSLKAHLTILLIYQLCIGASSNQNQNPFYPNQNQTPTQLVDVPILVANGSIDGQLHQSEASSNSALNFYTDSQAQRFRVNVSNICEKNHMQVTIRLSRPFYGLVHTKDKRRKANCVVEGTGEQTYSMQISYTLVQTDLNYCGIIAHHLTRTNQTSQHALSVILVVRLHKTIEFSDDRYFLLSCANRCSRSDCSSTSQDTSSISKPQSKGLTVSESIVSLVSRAPSNQVERLNDSVASWNAEETCDTVLELKFRWLLRFCWILGVLLAFVSFVALYSLFSLNAARSKEKKYKEGSCSSGKASNNQTLYSHLVPTESQGSWSVMGSEQVDNLPDQDNCLTNQRLFMANMTNKPFGTGFYDDSQICPYNQSQSERHQMESQVKRRRSIAGSMARLPARHQRGANGAAFEPSQRAKSRSQNTIYYEQSRDPFQTVPFSFVNNGCLADSCTPDVTLDQYGISAQSGFQNFSQPAQCWLPTFSNSITASQEQSAPSGHQASCQFDPTQHSHHLIDLIQDKHRQQITQANLTAKAIQPTEILIESKRQPTMNLIKSSSTLQTRGLR